MQIIKSHEYAIDVLIHSKPMSTSNFVKNCGLMKAVIKLLNVEVKIAKEKKDLDNLDLLTKKLAIIEKVYIKQNVLDKEPNTKDIRTIAAYVIRKCESLTADKEFC